jgi:hypothetical protein
MEDVMTGSVTSRRAHSRHRSWRNVVLMCRSIKTLREPYTEHVTDADVRAAALQYVRKISGFRAPASHNAQAFEQAVAAVSTATKNLLDQLEVRGQRAAS